MSDYLERVIPKLAALAKEGAVQAAATAFDSDEAAVLDREVAMQFRDVRVRQQVMIAVSADLLSMLDTAPVERPRPPGFGWRCDLLGVDKYDRLLAIEVKPRNVESIVWASAQAIVYARLLSAWAASDPDACDIVDELVDLRNRLGLAGDRHPARRPARPLKVRPMLAIQRGGSEAVIEDMWTVVDHLANSGVPEINELAIIEVSLSGRMIPIGR